VGSGQSDRVRKVSVAGRSVVITATAAVLLGLPARTPGWQAVELVLAFGGFSAVLLVERRAPVLTLPAVVIPAGALLVLAVAAPPVGSRDVWSYVMYGRILAVHHANPYHIAPAAFGHDPLLSLVSPVWRDTMSVYGPLFTAVSAAGMWLTGASALLSRMFFQLIAAGAAGGAMWLVWRETSDAAAVALVGLNPLVVVTVVNGGHSDALVGLGVLAGVALVVHRRPWLGGAVFGLAALVKIVALLPLAAVAAWTLWRPRGLRPAAAVVVAAVLTVAGGYAVAGGRSAIQPLSEARLHVTAASPWDEVRVRLTARAIADGKTGRAAGLEARRSVALGVDVAVLGLGLVLVLGLRRRRDTSPALLAGAAALAYLLLGGYVLPWYVAWAAFAMALCWRAPLTWALLGQGALLTLAYIPNPRTGGTIFAPTAQRLAESAELALRHTALPVISVAVAVTVMIVACFASSP
jgi:hypothetical protein